MVVVRVFDAVELFNRGRITEFFKLSGARGYPVPNFLALGKYRLEFFSSNDIFETNIARDDLRNSGIRPRTIF